MITLGGNICVRNGNRLDYCWREAIQSLLPVCDTVTVCDGESTDGTQEQIREWMTREPKIKLCVYPWPNPHASIDFWVDWLNFCRTHINEDFQIQLDADELLSDASYPAIEEFKRNTAPSQRVSLWCSRLNFWKDAKHLIPHGHCCGHRVVRVSPQSIWLPSDGPHPRGAEAVSMAIDSDLVIYHYGFLRNREAFFDKAKELQGMFFGSYDPRLADVEKHYKVTTELAKELSTIIGDSATERESVLSAEHKVGNWMGDIEGVGWTNQLVSYHGTHPVIASKWLKNRGWEL